MSPIPDNEPAGAVAEYTRESAGPEFGFNWFAEIAGDLFPGLSVSVVVLWLVLPRRALIVQSGLRASRALTRRSAMPWRAPLTRYAPTDSAPQSGQPQDSGHPESVHLVPSLRSRHPPRGQVRSRTPAGGRGGQAEQGELPVASPATHAAPAVLVLHQISTRLVPTSPSQDR